MIGTPGGVNGVSASPIAAPSTAACFARADVSCGTNEREEQRRERRVQPEPCGIADHVAEEHAQRRAGDPRDVEGETRAEQDPRVEPTVPSDAMAQDSSTTSCAWRNRDHHEPVRYGATLTPIGA